MNGHLAAFDEIRISRAIYRDEMPKLKQNIDIGDGVRAIVEAIDADVISVFAATPGMPYGENLKLRVIVLTEEAHAFVDLVRNAMITGFLNLSGRLDEVQRASREAGPEDSVHDIVSRVLGNEPIAFLGVRPFEVTEILDKLR